MVNGSPSLQGKKVFVTGAAGFIGSHLVERLVEGGASVTCLVHYNSFSSIGNLEHLDETARSELRIEHGNIEDGDYLLRITEGHDVIFHLAALISIPFSYVSPKSYLRTNAEGTLNVLEASKHFSVGRIVHTSSSEVYGSSVRAPIDESHPLQAQSPYSASKIAADKLAESFVKSFNAPVVTLRPFNTYGPRQSARAFIPAVVVQALEQDVVSLGNLHPRRDMTFVDDTVDAFVRAAATPGIEGETLNLGTGQARSIGEYVELILRIMDMDKPIRTDPGRLRPERSEVLNLVSDNRKAATLLGWQPRVSIEEGLRRTIEHIRQSTHLYQPSRYAT
jgi:NAD dependent epimerase/dehydratase